MSLQTYTGSCHCGAIRFEADLDLEEGSNRCNCSYCAKVRAWFAFAKGPDRFRLLDGAGVAEYRWTPPGESEPHLTFTFCRTCGVRTFARGELESLGGTFHAVHVPRSICRQNNLPRFQFATSTVASVATTRCRLTRMRSNAWRAATRSTSPRLRQAASRLASTISSSADRG